MAVWAELRHGLFPNLPPSPARDEDDLSDASSMSVDDPPSIASGPYPRPRLHISLSDDESEEAPPPTSKEIFFCDSDVEIVAIKRAPAPAPAPAPDPAPDPAPAPAPAPAPLTWADKLLHLYEEEDVPLLKQFGLFDRPEEASHSLREAFTQATRQSCSLTSLRDRVKKLPEPYAHRAGCGPFGWLDDAARKLVASCEAEVESKDARPFYNDTEELGKRLIELKFPLLGYGSHTLVFLVSERYVMKVSRFKEGSDEYHAHCRERELDVRLHALYPSCWAETFVQRTYAPYTFVEHRAYVQERLYAPFSHTGPNNRVLDKHPNNFMIAHMLVANRQDYALKQWAMTRRKSLETTLADGTRKTLDIEWYVGFDYE